LSSSDEGGSSSSGAEVHLCGTVEYTPATEACCGSGKYTIATQFCSNDVSYDKCGGSDYTPSTHFCLGGAATPLCGGKEFTASQFCSGNAVLDKCGGETFTASQFCSNNAVLDKCGGTVEYAPATEACCGSGKYALATHYCRTTDNTTHSCGNKPLNPATHLCDVRDGKQYRYARIDDQTWMAENLNYDVPGNTTDVCYDNEPDKCAQYGRLYDWATAKNDACPDGWHLPSQEEWDALSSYVESKSDCSSCDAKLLKAESGWKEDGNGDDVYGFSALPGGLGYSAGLFNDAGDYGYWWSASEYDSDRAYRRYMIYLSEFAFWGNYSKSSLFSVRCLQD
jgi:uncharacterized protein (TIGR02145 family)